MKIMAFLKRAALAISRRAAWLLCVLLPIRRNRIVVSNFGGRGYGDNPKYIVKELLSKGGGLEIVWLVKDRKEALTLPEGVKSCDIRSPLGAYYMATAGVWIDNCRRNFIFKRKKQLYIQTWHGFALKRIEKDVSDKLPKSYVRTAVHDSKHIDVMVSCSSFMTEIYKKAFWYEGDVLEIGAPRNDLLLGDRTQASKKVREAFSLDDGSGIILYAPTFRADGSLQPYSVDYKRLINACGEKFKRDFAVLVRIHPDIIEKCQSLSFGPSVINASYYPDVQELLAAADIVISDYSSLMFDFVLTGKPCFQFATDIEEYKKDRNFYFRLDELPFALAVDNDGLERNILSFEEKEYKQGLERFYGEVGMVRDGSASRKCAELVIKHCGK